VNSPPAEKRVATYSSAKWNGGDTLEALGVTRLGARLYDPVIGRFLSRDPLVVPRSAATTNPVGSQLMWTPEAGFSQNHSPRAG
jgi:RHS repeat-associated protein